MENHSDDTSINIRLIGHGGGIAVFCLPIATLRYLGIKIPGVKYRGPIPLLPTASLIPTLSTSTPQLIARRLITNIVHIGLITIVYLATIGAVFGGFAVLIGIMRANSITEVYNQTASLLNVRPVQFIIVVYAILAIRIINESVFNIIIQILIFVSVSGPLLVALGGGWLALRARADAVIQKILLYPLGVGTVVLPIIGGGLVTPSLTNSARRLTIEMAVILQRIFLAPIGLQQWASRTFDLEGLSFFTLWVVVTVVTGWLVGLVYESYSNSK